MGPAAARRCAARLADVPVEAALLGGFAGGLDPELAPGTLVVADPLLDEAGRPVPVPLAGELERAARSAGLAVRRGALISVARVVATPQAKAALRARSGALAVDMESAALATALAARGVPAGAARVVLDAAADALPSRGAGWLGGVARAAAWLRVGARIPGCARTSARLLESWLAGAGLEPGAGHCTRHEDEERHGHEAEPGRVGHVEEPDRGPRRRSAGPLLGELQGILPHRPGVRWSARMRIGGGPSDTLYATRRSMGYRSSLRGTTANR
jgi:hypothetical protein